MARGRRGADCEASVAPVGRNLAERHEALLVGDCAQARVGSEAGEGLSKASLECCREVADAIVAGGTVEAVAGRAVFE